MGKGKDAKKAVKKEPTKTPKERKAEKRLKKAKQLQFCFSLSNDVEVILTQGLSIFPV